MYGIVPIFYSYLPQMYGIVRDLIEQCIAQTPDVWEWTDEVAFVTYCPSPKPQS